MPWATTPSKTDCAHVYLWRTAGGPTGKWRYGKPTEEPCIEGLSTGSGISAVAMSAQRSLVDPVRRRQPARLAALHRDPHEDEAAAARVRRAGRRAALADRRRPGHARRQSPTRSGGRSPTWATTAPRSSGGRRRRPFACCAAGYGPGGAQVAAVLDSGVVALLSGTGKVVRSYTYAPGAVTAVSLGARRARRPERDDGRDPEGFPPHEPGAAEAREDVRLRRGQGLLLPERHAPRAQGVERRGLAPRRRRGSGGRRSARSRRRAASPGRSATRSAGPAPAA